MSAANSPMKGARRPATMSSKLRRGAAVGAGGLTPLMAACKSGHTGLAMTLLAADAGVDAIKALLLDKGGKMAFFDQPALDEARSRAHRADRVR